MSKEPVELSPWDRWSWLLGAVWPLFLWFPASALLSSGKSLAARGLGVAGLAVFTAVYLWGLFRTDRIQEPARRARSGAVPLILMVAIAAATPPLLGLDALSTLPFIACLALFALPTITGLVIWAVALAIAFTAPMLAGQQSNLLVPGMLVVFGIFVLLIRAIEQREATHKALVSQHLITQDRDRVARDVHDLLGHSLTGIAVKLELAERLMDVRPDDAKCEISDARLMARESLAEVRATVAGLRVVRLGDEVEAARTSLSDAGINPHLPHDVSTVGPQHRIVLAWALRELVTNVIRHSRATYCEVKWGHDWLAVCDDGTGLREAPEGNGIRGLRERTSAAGGHLLLTSGPHGRGTRVEVRL